CPMVALPTDVARGNKRTREAFETVFRAMVRVVESTSKTPGKARHGKAQAIAALCVGGMVVARAVEDARLADELRKSCTETALALGGWANTRALKGRKPTPMA